MPKCITIVSGGMDSVTLAYLMKSRGYAQRLLSFDYGQRHVKELECAQKIAALLDVPIQVVDLRSCVTLLHGSSQTDASVPVPYGHYAEENMRLTVVPNRNAIMLSIAYGAAVADSAAVLAYGAHAGDHTVYPDCRPEFVDALDAALHLGNAGFGDPTLCITAPFANATKADILAVGLKLGVPYEHTWTCYEGGDVACGRCATCVERLEAFYRNAVEDPLPYIDREYWKSVVTV